MLANPQQEVPGDALESKDVVINTEVPFEAQPYKDVPWAVVFLVHFIAVAGLIAYNFPPLAGGVSAIFAFMPLACAVAFLWFTVTLKSPKCLVWLALAVQIGILAISGLVSILHGLLVSGIASFVVAILFAFCTYWYRDRIRFTITLLRVANKGTMQTNGIFGWALLSSFFSLVVSCVFIGGVLASYGLISTQWFRKWSDFSFLPGGGVHPQG